jgi:hypothetical protein
MPRATRYLFCHYQMTLDEEELGRTAQFNLLSENQGDLYPYGRGDSSALIMSPERFTASRQNAFAFWIGYRPGARIRVGYDKARQRRNRQMETDDHIKSAHMVALPDLRVMAVEDRSGDENIPALQALRALRSILVNLEDGEGELEITHVTDEDVERALDEWDLTEYMYTVRPLNPISHTDRAQRRSEAYKAEGIGKESGKVWPQQGQHMRPNEGVIAETRDLVEVGYGQNGLRGFTPEGHEAHIPKPSFHMERQKNLAEREKPRLLRVLIEPEETEEKMSRKVAKALAGFYGR